MNPIDVDISIADWATHAHDLMFVRKSVFIDEQNVPVELEWDGLDPECTHFIVQSNSTAIATARLKDDGQIGRMAVLKPYRGLGIGTKLLTAVLTHATESGFTRVYCHAQVQVVDFYRKIGFTVEGEKFMDAGILHRAVYKNIC